MIAIDTNVVVRYLALDHPEQSARAREMVNGGAVFVPVTVVLEVEWVLRSAYGFSTAAITAAMRGFGGIATVTLEDSGQIAASLDLVDAGMDFADALHLVRTRQYEAFATFDRKLVRRASAVGMTQVREA
jgi:predicted nucleic-acid-binding protein